MNKADLIKLIADTDVPQDVDAVKYTAACREAVEFAFTHWLGDNGQDHSKNHSLIAGLVKKRDEILKP
jgi:hypothetical protein